MKMDVDDLVPFGKVAALIPGRPHIATLHRWRLRGVRGRKLSTVLIGGRRFVSRQSLADFLQPDAEATKPPGDLAQAALRRAEAAGDALRALGIR